MTSSSTSELGIERTVDEAEGWPRDELMLPRVVPTIHSWLRPWAPELTLVLGLTILVVVPVWPGVYTIDSQAMLGYALAHQISNWYAPLHGWAWALMDSAGLPPGTVLLFAVVATVVGLLVTYRLWLGRTAALVATAVTILWPPVYGLLGWVGRDVWYLAELIWVVALLGWSVRLPHRRTALLVAAGVIAFVAADARQNGFVLLSTVLAFAVVTYFRPRRRRVHIGLIMIACLVGALIGTLGVRRVQSLVVREHFHPEQLLYYYDLMGMSVETGTVLIPPSVFPEQDLQVIDDFWSVRGAVLAGAASQKFDVDPYLDSAHVTAVLRDAWRNAILAHPIAYAEVRGNLDVAMLGVSQPAHGAFYGSSDQIDWDKGAELQQTFPALNDARVRWLGVTAPGGEGGLLYAPWFYLWAAIGGAVVLGRRRRPSAEFGWALVALMVGSQLVLAVASPVPNYRYQLPTVVLGIVLAVAAAAALRAPKSDPAGAPEPGPLLVDGTDRDEADVVTTARRQRDPRPAPTAPQ